MKESVRADFEEVIELEQCLLERDVRLNRVTLSALLHEDFCEFGATGRVYDRASIIEALLESDGASANAFDFKAVSLGPNVVLLTYRTDTPSLRTSIWSRDANGAWRLLHHQGTRVIE